MKGTSRVAAAHDNAALCDHTFEPFANMYAASANSILDPH